jgi:hypothetical protein
MTPKRFHYSLVYLKCHISHAILEKDYFGMVLGLIYYVSTNDKMQLWDLGNSMCFVLNIVIFDKII